MDVSAPTAVAVGGISSLRKQWNLTAQMQKKIDELVFTHGPWTRGASGMP